MLKAGYSESTAREQMGILDGIKDTPEIKGIVDKLIDKRNQALAQITEKKLKESSARDNASIVDVFTKNIELLSGKPTERIEDKAITSEELADYIKWRSQKKN